MTSKKRFQMAAFAALPLLLVYTYVTLTSTDAALPRETTSTTNDWRRICDDFDSFFCTVRTEQDFTRIRKYFHLAPQRGGQMVSINLESTLPIPENILANYAAYDIVISGKVSQIQQIHPEAFSSSRQSAANFYIGNFNLMRSNFSFLDNFSALQSLHLINTNLKGVQPMAHLPSVNYIRMYNCVGLTRWPFLSSLTPNLKTIEINLGVKDDHLMAQFAGSVPNNTSLTFF